MADSVSDREHERGQIVGQFVDRPWRLAGMQEVSDQLEQPPTVATAIAR